MAQIIQATTVPTRWPSKPWLLVTQTDKYNHNLSEELLIINDTTNLNEGLPVINDTTNLSEGLPVVNDTSAKMTCVVDDLCGCPLNQCLDDLCGQEPV